MSRKIIISLILVSVLVVAYLGLKFYQNNLRGVWPAILKPEKDITEIIPVNQGTKNYTGMPLSLPDGFSIGIFAKNLDGPRVMAFDPNGRLVVSLTSSGQVVVLPDENVDFVADSNIVLLKNLRKPHGLGIRCEGNTSVQKCYLFVAEEHRIMRYVYDQSTPSVTDGLKIADLPFGSGHFTRTIAFGPDGRLYVSIGSSCNVCDEKDGRRAAIYSMNPDGSDFRQFANGLRNSVFFVWDEQGKMWATDNGRDLLGDDLPPDEINVVEADGYYGWPICYGKNIHDTNFDKKIYIRNPCLEPFEKESRVDLQAHSAPLGLAFIPIDGWPKEFAGDLLVAFHGSWNRSVPTGYKIVRVKLDENGNHEGTEDFISGWIKGNSKAALGRPVDIIAQAGGYMYVSDDKAGVIYHLVYASSQKSVK